MTSSIRVRHRARPTAIPEASASTEAGQGPTTTTSVYDVGYGKPPKGTRFKPGRSGNPKGRPKHDKNLTTAVDRELNGKVVIRDERGRRRVTKRQAVAMQLVKKAAEGDIRSINMLLGIDDKLTAAIKEAARAQAAAPSDQSLDANDQEILAELKRLARDELAGTTGERQGPPERAPEDKE